MEIGIKKKSHFEQRIVLLKVEKNSNIGIRWRKDRKIELFWVTDIVLLDLDGKKLEVHIHVHIPCIAQRVTGRGVNSNQ